LEQRYRRVLIPQSGLDLGLIMRLDKGQKGGRISSEESRRLKVAKLVEGRYPNLMVAGQLAALAGQKAQHIRNRGLDSRYYRDMIVALVREHQPVSREDIDRLLLDKLPEMLTRAQKLNRVHNLLRQLADAGFIANSGSRRWPQWVLGEKEGSR
jgi:ATP-dependent DNA helicase RecG